MQSLITQVLNPRFERRCIKCGKIFRKKAYVSVRAWEEKHKLCSRECVSFSANRGVREHHNKFWFKCAICGAEILGRKRDLKQHKHDQHAH